MKTARDMVVSLHYTLTDDSGEVLDNSSGREPLEYLHGHGNIIPGLERALEGTEIGHRSQVSVAPEEGYGRQNPDLVFEAPREHFPKDMKLEPGARVYAEGPEGRSPSRSCASPRPGPCSTRTIRSPARRCISTSRW